MLNVAVFQIYQRHAIDVGIAIMTYRVIALQVLSFRIQIRLRFGMVAQYILRRVNGAALGGVRIDDGVQRLEPIHTGFQLIWYVVRNAL